MFRTRRPPTHDRLELCPASASDFVSPTDWAENDETTWWIRLRCGECETVREVVVSDATAQRYDLALDRARDAIASALRTLDRERMRAETETFATALRLDLLDAEDFTGR